MNVLCPHCHCKIPFVPELACGQMYTGQRLPVRGEVDISTGEIKAGANPVSAYYELRGPQFSIVNCIECHKEFVVANWPLRVVAPLPEPEIPQEIPERVARALKDAEQAHMIGADIGALMAGRTALIRMLREQNCSRIDDLAKEGKITPLLAQQANEARHWANLLAHEDLPADVPAAEDVGQLLRYLDMLFDVVYVQPRRLNALKEKRESR